MSPQEMDMNPVEAVCYLVTLLKEDLEDGERARGFLASIDDEDLLFTMIAVMAWDLALHTDEEDWKRRALIMNKAASEMPGWGTV